MDDESGESMELMEEALLTVAQQERDIGAFPPVRGGFFQVSHCSALTLSVGRQEEHPACKIV